MNMFFQSLITLAGTYYSEENNKTPCRLVPCYAYHAMGSLSFTLEGDSLLLVKREFSELSEYL